MDHNAQFMTYVMKVGNQDINWFIVLNPTKHQSKYSLIYILIHTFKNVTIYLTVNLDQYPIVFFLIFIKLLQCLRTMKIIGIFVIEKTQVYFK